MPKFIVTQGAEPGTEIPINGNMVVFGRADDCDVILVDPNVSRRHAHAVMLNGMVAVVDLGSSNGTLVNGIPISRIFLMDGDQITLGATTLQFAEERELNAEVGSVRPDNMGDMMSRQSTVGSSREDEDEPSKDPLSHTKMFSPASEDVQIDALKDIYLKLKSLYRIFVEVAQAASLKEMFEAVGRGITVSTSIQRVVFSLNAEKSGGTWERYFTHGSIRLSDQQLNGPEFKPLLEQASTTKKAVLARVEQAGGVIGAADSNVLVIPLVKAGKVTAILYADNPESMAQLSREDVDFVTTLALQLTVRLNQFEQVQKLTQENQDLRRSIDEDFAVVVQNENMKRLMSVAERVAATDSTALITGESGTGKELIARTIHRFSTRGSKPLVAVNCAALSETLLESELFGHEKGAFTGAHERRVGKFELADGGTLFLDEIGDISASAQAKLLRVLQEGELQRVGGNKNIKVDVRLITATNKDLAEEVQKGTFRHDLFYRLRVIEINIPPLRQRSDDIPALAEYFFKQLRQRINTPVKRIGASAVQALTKYPWPGNVRELRNVIERGLVFAFGDELLVEHLPPEFQPGSINAHPTAVSLTDNAGPQTISAANSAPQPDTVSLAEMEKRHIQYVLNFVRGNKLKAAGLLGISRTTLYEKLKQYELDESNKDETNHDD